MNKGNLQWHPAFYAGLQIELERDSSNLIFENEHMLGTLPKAIDVLIIKKIRAIPTQKNIGKIFRKYNIIEYKSPEDYLSIDDFYQVYGYTCFYKADANHVNMIKATELTITLVSMRYPRKMLESLQKDRKYQIIKIEDGLYYLKGDAIPIQLIVTAQLSQEENLWLRGLSNDLYGKGIAINMVNAYESNQENKLYSSVMNVTMRANEAEFQEENGDMCEAMRELFKEELEEAKKQGREEGREEGRELSKELSVRVLIMDNLEEGKEQSCILAKIQKRFDMDMESAEKYFTKYAMECCVK